MRMLGLDFCALLDAPVARISEDILLLTVQQRVRLGDVVRIGRRGGHAVHQSQVGIRPDMSLHAVMPLDAIFGLVNLRVARTRAVLRRTRGCYQGGVDHRALLEQQQTLIVQRGVIRGQDQHDQVIGSEQVAKAQDSAFIGQVVLAGIQSCKLAEHRSVVQRLLNGRVRKVEPLLKEVDPQHGLHGKSRSFVFRTGLGRVRCNQRHQFSPRHH